MMIECLTTEDEVVAPCAKLGHGKELELCQFLKNRNGELRFFLPVPEMRNCESKMIPYRFQFQINCRQLSRNQNHNSLLIGLDTSLKSTKEGGVIRVILRQLRATGRSLRET